MESYESLGFIVSFLEFLVFNGYICADILQIVESESLNSGKDVFETIESMDVIEEKHLSLAKSEFFGLDFVDLRAVSVNFDSFLDIEFCSKNSVIIFGVEDDLVNVAVHNPENLPLMDLIKEEIHKKAGGMIQIKFSVAKKSEICSRLMESALGSRKMSLELIISDAILQSSSDIHITPFAHIFVIQFRVDGLLKTYKTLHKDLFSEICVKVKVLCKLDITENRRPQSGGFSIKDVDFRVSFHPTKNGENVVIRILNRQSNFMSIEQIGFSNKESEYLKNISKFSDGMIIFCGPTGSGKTTSIYSLLETVDKNTRNVMTLEDPVEYKMLGVRQTEIKSGLIDFALGIKSILRQDPDVIFIGEVRDEETAKMSVRASMTGHLVFTTVHSNDSLGAIYRFIEFGIPRSIICDNVISIISQRLVGKKCGSGRTIISEILHVDSGISKLICDGESKQSVLEYAKTSLGFRSIQENCKTKVERGITTHEEMCRVLRSTEYSL
jgi:general secretion pathway protein E/type IV pilus assembly protein PilB